MRFSLYLSTAIAVVVLVISIYHIDHASAASTNSPQAPQQPSVGEGINKIPPPAPKTFEEPEEIAVTPAQSQDPTELSIPSIKLDVPVVPVGLNSAGQMDVPSGTSGAVGWYKDGVRPGEEGSAVIDAHVFAAFSNLRYAEVGDDIYVTENGTQLHFKITNSMIYPLADVPADHLFNESGGKYLNLITCAGVYDASLGTYDHRLVDYAVLVNN